MIRLTPKIFTDLAILMIGLGLLTGIMFPLFLVVMGVPKTIAFTPWFFAACMAAGFLVGGLNILLSKKTVGRRLRLLAERMRYVESHLRRISREGRMEGCAPESCSIVVDSEDEIGESSRAFNFLIEALSSSYRTDSAVRSFTEMLSSQLDLDTLASQALHQLMRHLDANAGAIFVETEGDLKVAAAYGLRSAASIIENDHVREALLTLKRIQVSIPEGVLCEAILTEFRPREVIVEPVSYKGIPLGVIVLAGAREFRLDALDHLDLFSQGMALAFNNALTHDRLQRLAAIDPLTGIYNRRFGLARLHEEFSRAVRGELPIGVIMFDIDHFKKVNDTYGHIFGDKVLLRVAKAARSVMREGDILLRYGGEEFLAILPAASRNDAVQVGERLRRIVEETTISNKDQLIHVTISIGVTAYPETDVENETDLIKQADQALYSAKESGRNRVIAV
ncbi:MAG: GGDEF domain-containing protein [Candidatus Aminicenantes bacterium]|nr:GGDEF domain-containing protein [Candidatus Aminicenantes bacterium]